MDGYTPAFQADEYDRKIKNTLPYYEEFYRQVVDVAQVYPSPSWLDIGCGTGKMAEVASRYLAIKEFTCCDCSIELLHIAQSRFPHFKFLLADALELSFTSEFDIITAIQVNHYFRGQARITAISKCYQALKKGGMYIIFENFAPYSDFGKTLSLNRWKKYQFAHGKSAQEVSTHIDRYGKNYFPITISQHFKILRECGFQVVEILWLSYMQVGLMAVK